jgi:uncharacterized protein
MIKYAVCEWRGEGLVDEDLIGRINDLCLSTPEIVSVHLFGSVAEGKAKPTSDMDFAVLLEDCAAEGFPLLSFASALERLCNSRVDLIVLNRAGEVLKYQVRKSGRLIFDRDSEKRRRFEIYSRKAYEDFLYLHRRYVKAVLYKDG